MALTDKLTAIADAIREKTGSTDGLTLDGMAEAIAAIEAGGGDTSVEDALVERALTSYTNNRVERIGEYVFSNSKLTSVEFLNATEVGMKAFQYCSKLVDVRLPKVSDLESGVFEYCSSLTKICLPAYDTHGGTYQTSFFTYCTKLRIIDLPLCDGTCNYMFNNCKALVALIFRRTDKIAALHSSISNVFKSTPIESGTGYIYVPSALLEEYKVATNWTTYANQFRPLESYTVDGTVTGELDESKI